MALDVRQDRSFVLTEIGINELAWHVDREDIKERILQDRRGAQGPQAFAGRHVHQCQGQEVVLFCDAGNVVVLLRRHGIFQGNRPRCNDLDDLPLDDALGQLRVFHLLANSDLIALVHEPFNIRIGRMEGHAAHRCPVLPFTAPARQRQVQFPRRRQGIVKKHFIKVAETEK